ncbi:Septin-domain-containing protein [Polychytrium aggregatum]|uniref:Septin-domain-containing protein n=1 Tax=Polychytrium aggregatum TaxID=110093 RepID=UPI0022FF03BD|nr:Septin-domain-containing protein [Polychytrium aggregatum]KAI9208321.1 Septin-domain-containing protein [Polychytrium aggregatum]
MSAPSPVVRLVKRSFSSSLPDQLQVQPGDVLVQHRGFPDGWIFAQLATSGAHGFVPPGISVESKNSSIAPASIPPVASAQFPAPFKVTRAWSPLSSDELTTAADDLVQKLFEYEDGWAFVLHSETQAFGFHPSGFLQSADGPEEQDGNAGDLPLLPFKGPLERTISQHRILSSAPTLIENQRNLDSLKSPLSPRPVESHFLPTSAASLGSLLSRLVRVPIPVTDEPETVHPVALKWKNLNLKRQLRAPLVSQIGNVKIAIVGDLGIGKTTLVKRLFSLPEIYEIEPSTTHILEGAASGSGANAPATRELRASTVTSADQIFGESKYNITVIDTPGYGYQTDAMKTILPVLQYHESQFKSTDKLFAPTAQPVTIQNLLKSGTGGHSHVDVCLYGILHRLKAVDIEYIRLLSPFTIVIPVILKSDSMSKSEIFRLKTQILKTFDDLKIPLLTGGMTSAELTLLVKSRVEGTFPFAVSGLGSEVDSERDASKVLDEFEELGQFILYHQLAELRVLTSEKFTTWRRQLSHNQSP